MNATNPNRKGRGPGRPSNTPLTEEERLAESLRQAAERAKKAEKRKLEASNARKAKAAATARYHDYSITIQKLGADLDVEAIWLHLQRFLDVECISGVFSVERGSSCGHLHIQGCIRTSIATRAHVIATLMIYLFWDRQLPLGCKIVATPLTNKNFHTFAGICRYCMKDQHKAHFRSMEKDVSDEDKLRGEDLFRRYVLSSFLSCFLSRIIYCTDLERPNSKIGLC